MDSSSSSSSLGACQGGISCSAARLGGRVGGVREWSFEGGMVGVGVCAEDFEGLVGWKSGSFDRVWFMLCSVGFCWFGKRLAVSPSPSVPSLPSSPRLAALRTRNGSRTVPHHLCTFFSPHPVMLPISSGRAFTAALTLPNAETSPTASVLLILLGTVINSTNFSAYDVVWCARIDVGEACS